MIISSKTWRIALVSVAVCIALSALAVQAQNENPKILPPNSTPYGMTYGEWSAKWWQYVLALPQANNPLSDTTGQYCSTGQLGPVFFLVGTTSTGAVTRSCTIPAGKALLIPIINSACAKPDDGTTDEAIAACSSGTINLVTTESLKVVVDGKELQGLDDYRFTSPIFSFTGNTPNIFSPLYEGYREYAFADGYWVMLAPLPAGNHTIHFEGEIPSWAFKVDVTYNLTVAPGKP